VGERPGLQSNPGYRHGSTELRAAGAEFNDLAHATQEELGTIGDKLAGIAEIRAIFGTQASNGTPPADRVCHTESLSTQCYLMGFSSYAVHGTVVVAMNNPDTATDVMTYVPGTTSGLNGHLDSDVARAGQMLADAAKDNGGVRYSVIMWQGYDPPQTVPGTTKHDPDASDIENLVYALSHDPAILPQYAPHLRDFQAGIREAHDGPSATHTVLGHSYGNAVIGQAALAGLVADRLVFVAAPGMMASTVNDLRLISNAEFANIPLSNRVWATTASDDPIKTAAALSGIPLISIFGNDPVDPALGARVFASDSGAEVRTAHTEMPTARRVWLSDVSSLVKLTAVSETTGPPVTRGPMHGELDTPMTNTVQNPRHRRNAQMSIAAAGVTLFTASACGPQTEPLPAPSYTYQQAIQMTQQRINDVLGEIKPRPRFEEISSDGKVPCSGPNDDEDTGQIMYERSGWLRDVPKRPTAPFSQP
jgi:hypothetical protein